MLKNVKTINLIKGIGCSLTILTVGAGIGLGYYYSNQSNPYNNFFKRPTNYGDTALQQSYQSAVLNGADVVIGAGFTHNSVISNINSLPTFNNIGFLGIDVAFSGKNGWNVATVNFKTEQSGFLAAIAAAEFLNQNQNFFLESSNDILTYSAWGGMSGQSVDSYLSGFQQGIIYFNNELLPKLKNIKTNENKDYQKIYLAMPTKFYAGGFGVGDANAIIDEIISGNCTILNADGSKYKGQKPNKIIPDIVFPVAGPQTATLVTKIYTDQARIAVVGVDSAMEIDPMTTKEFNIKGVYPKLNNQICKSIIPFSAIKDIENATSGILTNILNGITNQISDDDFGGLGWYSIGDIKNNGAGISNAGYDSLINIMKKTKLITDSTYDSVKKYFTTQYDISDINILTTEVINNINGNKTKYTPLRSPGWLIEKKANQTDDAFAQEITQFEKTTKNFATKLSQELLNLKQNNKSDFKNSIKLILSTPNSVLFDHSFSESVYLGLSKFYEQEGAPIPKINS